MTVESSLAVPIFIFFMANLLWMITLYESVSDSLSKLHSELNEATIAAHLAGPGVGDDCITMSDAVELKPLVPEIAWRQGATILTLTARKWTGYDIHKGEESEEDEYVYITENGSVYHRSKSCSHLKVSIRIVDSLQIDSYRNKDRAKYYPCEYCSSAQSSGLLFITDYGNRYHASPNCSGLKRVILTRRLKEVEGYPPCSSCS